MLKARTNHLSRCEGSQEEDLHTVKKKKKEYTRPHPTEGWDERRQTRLLSSFSNRETQFPRHPSCIWQISAVGRAKSCFVIKVKNFLLGDPNWGDQSSPKVLRRRFIMEYLLQGEFKHLRGPFVSLYITVFSSKNKTKQVCERERQKCWPPFTNKGRQTQSW